MRKHYLDNIRWATVLTVLVYHVFYIFNNVGILGGIPNAKNIPLCDTIACVIYPWFMALLFIIAGMSARYSLQKRSGKQFIKERAVKMLIPASLGLFVFQWITGYLNIKIGGGLEYIPPALVYPIAAISGIGPLWFVQMLFIFSAVLLLLRKIDKNDSIWTLCGKANIPIIAILFVPVLGASQILNMPVFTMYRFGIYFVSFLIGYYIFSHEEVLEKIGKIHIPALCLAVVGMVLYAVLYGGSNYTSPECLQSIVTNLYLWVVILAIIGCGRKYFDKETAFTRYMTASSFGIYVLHYPILLTVCFCLHSYFDLPASANYIIAFAAEIILTFAAYELIRRIPVVRFCILGMKKKKEKNNESSYQGSTQ